MNYKKIIFTFLVVFPNINLYGQKKLCHEHQFLEQAFSYMIPVEGDTLVIEVGLIPSLTAITDWKNQGIITSKEKRKIELAFKKNKEPVCIKTQQLVDSINNLSNNSKNKEYTKKLFSRPIRISKTRVVVFHENILQSKYHSGGKAVGCLTGIFFGNETGNWKIIEKKCLEMY